MTAKKKCLQCNHYGYEHIRIHGRSFCNTSHAVEWSQAKVAKDRAKAYKKAVKEDNKAAAKLKRDNKKNDFRHQFNLTKAVLQKWVNHVRDFGKPCISCGTEKPTIIYSGGHMKTAGGHSEIALDTRNIHRQCLNYCNKNLSGNIEGNKHSKGFKQGLIDRYGIVYLEWLEAYHEPHNYTCDQLIEIRAYYNQLIRDNDKDDSGRPF